MNEERSIIKISVRNLVEFLLRSGDITPGGAGVQNLEAMQEGSRIHRKIQKSMGVGYEAEVPLVVRIPVTSPDTGMTFTLQIEGRADGIWRDPDQTDSSSHENVLIDEIKGVYADPKDFSEPDPLHLAQAMCYAYMVVQEEELSDISVQITYCHIETEHIRRFKEDHSADEVISWFNDLISMYIPWAIYRHDHALLRDSSISTLGFPFDYREGQAELVGFTYTRIRDKKRLFIEAPTGVGKTVSTVFPAVKAMGEGMCERIFYLTAKTITRTVAEDCFSLLKDNGLVITPITITAKEKLCCLDKPDCDPTVCSRARGHYDRVNDALYNMLTNEEHIDRETVADYAARHDVCPFELNLDAANFADAVICDYNYVFDPNVYLRRFFQSGKKGNQVLLIDEAHNLVERGREMYSAAIVKEDFLKIARLSKKMLKTEHRPDAAYSLRLLIRSTEAVNKYLLELKRQCDRFSEVDNIDSLGFKLLSLVTNYEVMTAEIGALPERETFVEFYFSVRFFLAIWESMDDHYRIYTDYDDEGNFRLTLKCMDPSGRLREVMDNVRSTIMFSATLLPIRYYKEQLGGDADDEAVYARSSFPRDNRRILIANDVTSLYRRRGPEMYKRIADYLAAFVTAREGNYLIFFPSYIFMEEVAGHLELPGNIELLTQDRHMSETAREDFLKAFDGDNVVGLCVMGGVFSEGIDLTGDRLIGAAIVGTGLPMVCDERELFKRYFDEINGSGFDYAYLFPGISKVFQAGGRVIRTATDRGVVLLLDDRFLRREYRGEFPKEWNNSLVVSLDTIRDELYMFWQDEK